MPDIDSQAAATVAVCQPPSKQMPLTNSLVPSGRRKTVEMIDEATTWIAGERKLGIADSGVPSGKRRWWFGG